MTGKQSTSLAQRIRDALRDSEGMTIAQLADALGEDAKRVGGICYQQKFQGEFVSRREEGGVVYALNSDATAPRQNAHPNQNAEGPAAVPPPGATSKKPKLERPRKSATKTMAQRKRDFFAAAETAEKTLKALQFNVTTAADAIEVYVHSVVDPVTYTALKNAHVSALAALEAFSAQGAEA